MKVLISIVIVSFGMGCGEKQAANPNEDNSTPEKTAKKKVKREPQLFSRIIGKYYQINNPFNQIYIREGGGTLFTEVGNPDGDEEGSWAIEETEVHFNQNGEVYIFEVKDNGDLQIAAYLKGGGREDAPEQMRRQMILTKIKQEELTEKNFIGVYDWGEAKMEIQENGILEIHVNDEKVNEGSITVIDEEVYFNSKTLGAGYIFRPEPNENLTLIAAWKDGRRIDAPESKYETVKKRNIP